MIIPLQEDELEFIAYNKREFECLGILVVVSDIETIKLCRDKYMLYKALHEVKISCVPTYDYETEVGMLDTLEFPVFMKERSGAGSVGAMKIETASLMHEYAKNTKEKLIVQPFFEAIEYGIDFYADMNTSEVISIFIKEKLRMRAGETEKSVSVHDEHLFRLVEDVAKRIRFRGPIDMDVLKKDGEYYILEINPRFGGGYPHAYECGINFMKNIYNNTQGIIVDKSIGQYESGQVMLKFTDAILKREI